MVGSHVDPNKEEAGENHRCEGYAVVGRVPPELEVAQVLTDEGIVGLGEWVPGASVEPLKRTLVGRDPININTLHHDHLWQMIKGKQLGVPMHELLGGKLRDRVRIYCDCHAGAHWTQEEYNRRWEETRSSGDLDPVYETEAYVAAAREVVPKGSPR